MEASVVETDSTSPARAAATPVPFRATLGRVSVRVGLGIAAFPFESPRAFFRWVDLCEGGGVEIALACDLIVASERAVFALPEPRVGLAALAGGIHRLPRQIGLKNAMGMLLTGRRVSAEEGLRLGFVNEVVPAAELAAAARRWAETICECAPLSVRASKQAALRGLDAPSLREAVDGRYEQLAAMIRSQDFLEGPRAFAEKRKREWKGR